MGLKEVQVGRVKEHLLTREKVLDIAFPSRLLLAKWYSAAFGLLVVSILIYRIPVTFLPQTGFMLAVFIGTALLLVVYAELRRYYEFMVITNHRVFHIKGIITNRFTDFIIKNISDTAYAQGLVGTIFKHGTISINTPGSPHAEIVMRGVLFPERRKRLIDSLIHASHRSTSSHQDASRNVHATRKQ